MISLPAFKHVKSKIMVVDLFKPQNISKSNCDYVI